jgi:membrane protein implicated in regulation of membrane protease activity
MTEAMSWFLAAGLVIILELFVGTFYLLMVAAGIFAGGIAVTLGASLPVPALVAAIVGAGATLLLRLLRRGKKARIAPARDPNVSLDIGQTLTVTHWHDGTARVMYRGALWDVELAPGAKPIAGLFTIREIRGSRLIVG